MSHNTSWRDLFLPMVMWRWLCIGTALTTIAFPAQAGSVRALIPQGIDTRPETIPISMRGAMIVAALGDERVLLAGAKQSWMWNGRARQLTPLPRIGSWRPEYGLQGVYTGGRLLLAGTPHPNKDAYATLSMETSPQHLLLYDPATEQISSARLRVKRLRYNMVALSANQVLILGGTVPGSALNDRAWQVELVSWDKQGTLKVEMLPGMNDSRRDGQSVRLPDGRVMAIGGMRDTTEFFDPATRRWRYGPSLESPFTRGQVASFRDGKILVIQGSAWLWRPGSDSWENLDQGKELDHLRGITAISDHEVIGVAGRETRIFDVRDKSLRVGPDLANPHSDVRFVPFSNGELHVFDIAWANDDEVKPIEIVRTVPSGQRPSGALAMALSRIVPARLKDGQVLLAGNWNGLADNQQRSTIVNPLLPGFQVLKESGHRDRPPLGVFTLVDGSVLVVGGEILSSDARHDSNRLLASQRWFPATGSWRRVEGPAIRAASDNEGDARHSIFLRANGEIVFIDASQPSEHAMRAHVKRWNPENGRTELLGSLRKWRSGASLIELRDGRLAVMGGRTQSDIIAVDKPCTDCADDYLSIGRVEEATSTEVFNEPTRSWVPGPRSLHPGGQAVRLADGRIVKISTGEGIHMEISDTGFTRWQSVEPHDRLRQIYSGHLLVLGQRLVVIGHRFDKDTPALIWSADRKAWQEWTTDLSLSVEQALVLDEKRIFILGRDTARSGHIGTYLTLTVPP